jgi:hypothetical protein
MHREYTVRETEFKAADGTQALVNFVVTFEDYEWEKPELVVDPDQAEIWPATVASPAPDYAMDVLTGAALTAWVAKYHAELVDLALDHMEGDRERHDEEMAERR